MNKLKGLAFVAVVVFFIAYNPDGAAALAGALWDGFVTFVDGAGTVAERLAGDR